MGSAPPPTRGYRVKTQWQKAVRRLSSGSGSHGTSPGSRNTSPSPTDPAAAVASGSPDPPLGPRTSMEKPGWAVHRNNPHAQVAAYAQCRRTRHLSLTVDGSGTAPAAPAPPRPPLCRGESSPLPTRQAGPGGRARRASVANPVDEFPYSPAFAYAPVGRESTHFPCGSEAVMINSALALEAFRSLEEVNSRCSAVGDALDRTPRPECAADKMNWPHMSCAEY